MTPSRGLVVLDFIVNLIFVNILKNEECAKRREKCRRKKLKHNTLKKNFKKISKEMPWTGFEHVPHASLQDSALDHRAIDARRKSLV